METDIELLQAARMMDEEALVKIFDLYARPLYKYALRLCEDPLVADHIVGDVFAKFLDQLSAGHCPNSNLRSYLFETAYHLIVDKVRISRRSAPLEALTFAGQKAYAPLSSVEDPILLEMISHAIKHDLTDDQRHVIILRFLEEFSLRETAALLGKSIGHVKVIQTRALAKLRKACRRSEVRLALSLPRMEKQSEVLNT
jgi:RNA polymerase sigma factor (sigma-70 family)